MSTYQVPTVSCVVEVPLCTVVEVPYNIVGYLVGRYLEVL